MSDSQLLMGVVGIMIVIAIFIPYVETSFSDTVTTIDSDGLVDDIGQGDVSATDVFLSIFKMFFWVYPSSFPLFLNIFFVILKIMLAVLITKIVRGVGG